MLDPRLRSLSAAQLIAFRAMNGPLTSFERLLKVAVDASNGLSGVQLLQGRPGILEYVKSAEEQSEQSLPLSEL